MGCPWKIKNEKEKDEALVTRAAFLKRGLSGVTVSLKLSAQPKKLRAQM
jgi:hypothetical protein